MKRLLVFATVLTLLPALAGCGLSERVESVRPKFAKEETEDSSEEKSSVVKKKEKKSEDEAPAVKPKAKKEKASEETTYVNVDGYLIEIPVGKKWEHSPVVSVCYDIPQGDVVYEEYYLGDLEEAEEELAEFADFDPFTLGFESDYYEAYGMDCLVGIYDNDGWFDVKILQDVGADKLLSITVTFYEDDEIDVVDVLEEFAVRKPVDGKRTEEEPEEDFEYKDYEEEYDDDDSASWHFSSSDEPLGDGYSTFDLTFRGGDITVRINNDWFPMPNKEGTSLSYYPNNECIMMCGDSGVIVGDTDGLEDFAEEVLETTDFATTEFDGNLGAITDNSSMGGEFAVMFVDVGAKTYMAYTCMCETGDAEEMFSKYLLDIE